MRDFVPEGIATKPLSPTKANGIDFICVQQNSSLCCHIRFSKIAVDTADVATSRIPLAHIVRETSSACIGAWFNHNRKTYEVLSINIMDRICRCESVNEEGVIVALPLELVNTLVDEFGS
jgi:hypothetical protein